MAVYDVVQDVFAQLRTSTDISVDNPFVRFSCAVFSELAYFQIPAFEYDSGKRLKLFPCGNYGVNLRKYHMENRVAFPEFGDNLRSFQIESSGVVVVGLASTEYLFVAFRGTQLLFDWYINARIPMRTFAIPEVTLDELIAREASGGANNIFLGHYINRYLGKAHAGFLKESLSVLKELQEKISNLNRTNLKHVFFTGHSLGGAVALLCERLLHLNNSSVCMFGAPRAVDGYATSNSIFRPTQQIRRPLDVVPFLPPRGLGYFDYINEHGTDFVPIRPRKSIGGLSERLKRIWKSVRLDFREHYMRVYRTEIGKHVDPKISSKLDNEISKMLEIDSKYL